MYHWDYSAVETGVYGSDLTFRDWSARQMFKAFPLAGSSGIFLASVAVFLVATLATASCGQASAAKVVNHPMEPLTEMEYSSVITALKEESYAGQTGLYPLVTLEEPSRDEVLDWEPGDSVTRRAFVIVKKGPQTFEAIVDATNGRCSPGSKSKMCNPACFPLSNGRSYRLLLRAINSGRQLPGSGV